MKTAPRIRNSAEEACVAGGSNIPPLGRRSADNDPLNWIDSEENENKQDKDIGPISVLMSEQDRLLGILRNSIQNLAEAIKPVCAGDDGAGVKRENKRNYSSQLAEIISDRNERIEQLIDIVQTLERSVEL